MKPVRLAVSQLTALPVGWGRSGKLTRSPADFDRIAEVFDQDQVAFVAVSRRKFLKRAEQAQSKTHLMISPMALEAVERIDVLFDIEHTIHGRRAEERLLIRKEKSASLMAGLEN